MKKHNKVQGNSPDDTTGEADTQLENNQQSGTGEGSDYTGAEQDESFDKKQQSSQQAGSKKNKTLTGSSEEETEEGEEEEGEYDEEGDEYDAEGEEGGGIGEATAEVKKIARKVVRYIEDRAGKVDKESIAKYISVAIIVVYGLRKSSILGSILLSVAAGVIGKYILESLDLDDEAKEAEESAHVA